MFFLIFVFSFWVNSLFFWFILFFLTNLVLLFYFTVYKMNFYFMLFFFIFQEFCGLLFLGNFLVWVVLMLKFFVSPFYFWIFLLSNFLEGYVFFILFLTKKLIFINLFLVFFGKLFISIIFGLYLVYFNIYGMKNSKLLFILMVVEGFNWIILLLFVENLNFVVIFYYLLTGILLFKLMKNLFFSLEFILFLMVSPFIIGFWVKLLTFLFFLSINWFFVVVLLSFFVLSILSIFFNLKLLLLKTSKNYFNMDVIIVFCCFNLLFLI